MPQLQAFWNRLNANEKLVGYGIIVVLVSWLIGLIGGVGFGGGAIVPAIIVGVIYWLKYNSKTPIAWPIPVQTLVLIITAIEAILAVLSLLGLLSFGFLFGAFYTLALIGNAVGAGIMVYGAWKEYQSMAPTTARPTTPSAPTTSSTPTSTPPTSTPPSAPPPSGPPPAPPSSGPPPAPPAT
jgi:hypothetical protein